jgi:hypothetical protein
MFSVAMLKLEENYDRGIYKGHIIHFGASLKVDPANTDFADQWLQKFEQQLLTPLVWHTATVHFEHETAGKCTVSYTADIGSLREVYDDFLAVGSRVEARIQWERGPAMTEFS